MWTIISSTPTTEESTSSNENGVTSCICVTWFFYYSIVLVQLRHVLHTNHNVYNKIFVLRNANVFKYRGASFMSPK